MSTPFGFGPTPVFDTGTDKLLQDGKHIEIKQSSIGGRVGLFINGVEQKNSADAAYIKREYDKIY